MLAYSTTSMANQVWLPASTLSEAPAECQTDSSKMSPSLTANAGGTHILEETTNGWSSRMS